MERNWSSVACSVERSKNGYANRCSSTTVSLASPSGSCLCAMTSVIGSRTYLANSKLIDRFGGFALRIEHDFHSLFTLDIATDFIFQLSNDGLRLRVDDVATRRVQPFAVGTPRQPQRFVPHFDALQLLWRSYRIVEHVNHAVRSVRQPDLLFIGRQRDAMAGTAVTCQSLARPSEPLDLHGLDDFAGTDIANLETEEIVDIGVDQSSGAVNRERPDVAAERADCLHDGIRPGVGD